MRTGNHTPPTGGEIMTEKNSPIQQSQMSKAIVVFMVLIFIGLAVTMFFVAGAKGMLLASLAIATVGGLAAYLKSKALAMRVTGLMLFGLGLLLVCLAALMPLQHPK